MQIALYLACLSALPRLEIDGPAKIRPGDFGILKVVACAEENPAPIDPSTFAHRWFLVDSDKQYIDGGLNITFTTLDPGRYTFLFVYSDGQTLACQKHVLEVDGSPPPPPTPGPSPGPAPGPSRFGIAEAARQWVAEVPASARHLGKSFASRCRDLAKPVLDGHVSPDRQALINDLIAATNETLGPIDGEWGGFRKRMQAFIRQLDEGGKLGSPKEIARMIDELGRGVASG